MEYTLMPDPDARTVQQIARERGITVDEAVALVREEGWQEASHDEYGAPLFFPPEKE